MRGYLLDTHIWLWYATGSADLPSSLLEALDDALGTCWLSPISLWETNLLAKKGRIRAQGDMTRWIEQCLENMPMREASLNYEVAKAVGTLVLPHNDPADHFIAATAMVHELTLVTLDHHLVNASWLPTLTR